MPATAGTPAILVTGATAGLGKALACDLASGDASILLHGRSPERLGTTVRAIRHLTGSDRIHPYLADLSSLDEVRGLAQEVRRDHERLDVLVNNAAIGPGRRGSPRDASSDGYELRFAVNYLAPFLLTDLLLPLLKGSAPARIVNVASAVQTAIDFDDVMLERSYDGTRAYAQSKLALIAFTFELAERLRTEGVAVTANTLHPALLMNTKLVDESFGYTLSTVADGLRATKRLVTSPDLDGVTGRYFDELREARAHDQAYDAVARRRLWRLSQELAGLEGDAKLGQGAQPQVELPGIA